MNIFEGLRFCLWHINMMLQPGESSNIKDAITVSETDRFIHALAPFVPNTVPRYKHEFRLWEDLTDWYLKIESNGMY